MDLVEVLVPTPLHCDVACAVLEAGYHVNLQKPIARTMDEVDRILAARNKSGATLRIMEDYLFFEPLVRLKEITESGEIGRPAGLHMKMVATGRGAWDISPSSWAWQLQQMRDGLPLLMFDDGWHKFAVAHWLFGPINLVWAWAGRSQLDDDYSIGAPTTVVWEHTNGLRGVLDITVAPEMYFRSDYYGGDERVEVTGTKGFARVNRISAHGIQEPPLVVYRDGEMRGYHALGDDPVSAFRASCDHMLRYLRTGDGEIRLNGDQSRDVLAFVLAAMESSRTRVPVQLV